ncbi:MAG: GYD domain-containing protein [Haloarculaceae archaeon]
MPTYVTLAEYTQQGIERVTQGNDLTDYLESVAEDAEGEIRDVYLTFGGYDLVVVSEFPDDRSYAEFALAVGGQGDLSTETLKGITRDEYRDIAADLGTREPGGVPGEFSEG